MEQAFLDHRAMRKPRQMPADEILDPLPPLYIGEWITALGLKQAEVATKAQMNEGYISQLCDNAKWEKNLTIRKIAAIARAMGLDNPGLLFQPPPDLATIRRMAGLSPALIARLAKP